jgi:outer membrane receptor for ferrienterochelin and colicins
MKKIISLSFWMAALSLNSLAQTVLHGTVFSVNSGANSISLPGATVVESGTNNGTITDNSGQFSLAVSSPLPVKLIASFVGLIPDTFLVNDAFSSVKFSLKESEALGTEVQVVGKRQSTEISTLKTRSVEILGEAELLKAACCNLSESFETNPSVDVSYGDAVTGIKEIQLLGLSGIYTQMMAEAIPTLRGLAVPYGLNFVPGPWMESIQISKGAGSVANGYEALTGQINIEFKKPETTKPFFLNIFADDEARVEANIVANTKLSNKWKYMLMLNGSNRSMKFDNNNDGFLDQPLLQSYNMYNRFLYHSGKNLEGQIGVKTLYEDRSGGQSKFIEAVDKGTTNAYGFEVITKRAEVYTKTGLVFPATPWKSMGLQLSGTVHDQQSFYGLRTYNAQQQSFYSNYSYINILGNTDHKYKVGADYKWDYYNENLNDSAFTRMESVPGVYAEYTFGGDDHKLGIIAGARADYHNIYGWWFTPRLHLKYNFTDNLIVRVSGGRGYRTPNVYADNMGVFVSSKKLIVLESPKPEDAWNGGANITGKTSLAGHEASISVDYYYTSFNNQLIMDQYSQSDAVLYYNLNGSSTASSLQTTISYEIIDRLNLRLSYKIDDVNTDYLTVKSMQKPLLANNKALMNLSYATSNEIWKFDATLQWEGSKNLPIAADAHIHNPASENAIEKSPDYFLLQAQVTKQFRKWEAYLGGENLLNVMQHHPIISANDPFSYTFDATRIYGPIMGPKVYVGIRLTIN